MIAVIRQLGMGLAGVLFSAVMAVGSLALAVSEGPMPTWTPSPTAASEIVLVTAATPFPPTATASPVPPTACPPPEGWRSYTIQPGDTLAGLAAAHQVSEEALAQANCLFSQTLLPGSNLYLPPPPTATATATRGPGETDTPTEPPPLPTAVQCGPPAGWVVYIVQSGDTLFRIGQLTGASVPQLQAANCLGASTLIRAGMRLYVPRLPAATPTPTATPRPPSATPVPPSPTPVPPTDTPVPPSETPIPPSETPVPTTASTSDTPVSIITTGP